MPTGNGKVVRRTRLGPVLLGVRLRVRLRVLLGVRLRVRRVVPLVALLLSLTRTALAATPALTPEAQQVLVEAVEAAAALDFYNARCRSDDSGRNRDNLNKQLVNKLRLTIVTVQDEMFPEHAFRAVQKRLVEESAEQLRQAGGCKSAKDAGLADQLGDRYRKAVGAIEALP